MVNDLKNNKNIYLPMMASKILLKKYFISMQCYISFLFSNLVNIILFKNHKSHVYIQQYQRYLAFNTVVLSIVQSRENVYVSIHIKHMKYEKRHCLQLLQQNTM